MRVREPGLDGHLDHAVGLPCPRRRRTHTVSITERDTRAESPAASALAHGLAVIDPVRRCVGSKGEGLPQQLLPHMPHSPTPGQQCVGKPVNCTLARQLPFG